MDKIKKGLGRGLSSLIGETKIEPKKNQLLLSDLVPNKYQPRKIFNEANLEELTNSIKERGIIQPIIVRNSNDDKSKYEIIAGERRWLAAQRAGFHEVPVVITEAVLHIKRQYYPQNYLHAWYLQLNIVLTYGAYHWHLHQQA